MVTAGYYFRLAFQKRKLRRWKRATENHHHRKMGEELAKADLGQGKRTDLVTPRYQVSECPDPTPPPQQTKPTLADIGISKMQSSRYQALASIPADTFEAVVEAHKATGNPISTASVARTSRDTVAQT
jgi:hypothetical protein